MKTQVIKALLNNTRFLKVISNSFHDFLIKGTSRSTDKLIPLHGAIAEDLHKRLGAEYTVYSLGYDKEKEALVKGRYNNKRVDITVCKDDYVVAGIAVKFVMQNYSQNSNNYFENMLGETANIRTTNCLYFQIFIVLDRLPYYKNAKPKIIKKWESFTDHNADKYIALSKDNVNLFYHTPNKTLIYVVHIPDNDELTTQKEYINYYRNLDFTIQVSKCKYRKFGSAVILNDYMLFIDKVVHAIKAQ